MPDSQIVKCPYCAEEIQGEAIKCKHCGEWLDPPKNEVIKKAANNLIKDKSKSKMFSNNNLTNSGIILLLLGGFGAFYFFLIFDTSVPVPTTEILGQTFGGGRVNNIGLMQDKQNGIIISSVIAVIGVVLTISVNNRQTESRFHKNENQLNDKSLMRLIAIIITIISAIYLVSDYYRQYNLIWGH